MHKHMFLAMLGLTLFSQLTCANQLPDSTHEPAILHNSAGQNSQWNGIGRLSVADHQCIATLLDSRDSQAQAQGPAYILTAGHCAGGVNGKVLVDQPVTGSIAFNYFVDTPTQRLAVPLKRIVWNSLQGADLALVELDATLEGLLALGISPIRLGSSPPPQSSVQVIGEPSAIGQGLRLSTCTERYQAITSVGNWVWRNVRRNDCQGLAEGASGSPVLETHGNRLVSVVNSLHDDGVGAIPTERVQGCFSAGKADLELDTCQLLPGFQLEPQGNRFKPLSKIKTLADGSVEQPSWNFEFLIDTPRYRYKTSTDALACEDPTGYSGTVSSSENLIDDPIGPAPGIHYLCLLGVQDPDQLPSNALMANSLSIAAELLPAGKPTAQVATEQLTNGNLRVTWQRARDVVFYRVKRGAPETTDCDDLSGYRLLPGYTREVEASALPLKLCSVAIDLNLQSSDSRTDLLQAKLP
ncbi:trypsin-like peptidase domain-containing protein [Pseudomonas sp. NPDC089752]|uniref:trypsin-like peptidase domain-containing protein n=1 Tax=Pseudomonas sp. NPDC089752 TaxID=3364472 RepID=UPI0037F37F18